MKALHWLFTRMMRVVLWPVLVALDVKHRRELAKRYGFLGMCGKCCRSDFATAEALHEHTKACGGRMHWETK